MIEFDNPSVYPIPPDWLAIRGRKFRESKPGLPETEAIETGISTVSAEIT
jgi:hypothetical protein